jgi:hypothetical protein
VPPSVDLAQEDLLHEKILHRRLVKKANSTLVQIMVECLRLGNKLATWKNYNVLKAHFPDALAWGASCNSRRGHCYTCYRHVDNRGCVNLKFTRPQVGRIKVPTQLGMKCEANRWCELCAAWVNVMPAEI